MVYSYSEVYLEVYVCYGWKSVVNETITVSVVDLTEYCCSNIIIIIIINNNIINNNTTSSSKKQRAQQPAATKTIAGITTRVSQVVSDNATSLGQRQRVSIASTTWGGPPDVGPCISFGFLMMCCWWKKALKWSLYENIYTYVYTWIRLRFVMIRWLNGWLNGWLIIWISASERY